MCMISAERVGSTGRHVEESKGLWGKEGEPGESGASGALRRMPEGSRQQQHTQLLTSSEERSMDEVQGGL